MFALCKSEGPSIKVKKVEAVKDIWVTFFSISFKACLTFTLNFDLHFQLSSCSSGLRSCMIEKHLDS